jgi:hypothetical protein
VTTQDPVSVPMTIAECFASRTAAVLSGLAPVDQAHQLRAFAIRVPFEQYDYRSRLGYEIVPLSFEGDMFVTYSVLGLDPAHQGAAALAMAAVIGDPNIAPLGREGLSQRTDFNGVNEGVLLNCFSGGIVIERAKQLPKFTNDDAASRDLIHNHFIVRQDANLSAHQALQFMHNAELFIFERLWNDGWASRRLGKDHPLRLAPITLEQAPTKQQDH